MKMNRTLSRMLKKLTAAVLSLLMAVTAMPTFAAPAITEHVNTLDTPAYVESTTPNTSPYLSTMALPDGKAVGYHTLGKTAAVVAAQEASGENEQKLAVIVELETGTQVAKIKRQVSLITEGNAELSYTYEVLLHGFAAKVPLSYIPTLQKVVGVKAVYAQVGYTPMSLTGGKQSGGSYSTVNNSAYQGQGMVVAILDTGFMPEHSHMTMKGTGAALTKEAVDGIAGKLSADSSTMKRDDSFFLSEKVPFAYDYTSRDTDVFSLSNHGGMIAGIIGGNTAVEPEEIAEEGAEDTPLEMPAETADTAEVSGGDAEAAEAGEAIKNDGNTDRDGEAAETEETDESEAAEDVMTEPAESGAALLTSDETVAIYQGMVPEAQLLLMKVYSDSGISAYTGDVLAAMEDAYRLGADVVNLGFGAVSSGLKNGLEQYRLGSAVEKITELGVSVVCPAGNYGGNGGSFYGLRYGIETETVLQADNGNLADTAQNEAIFTVASKQNDAFIYYCVRIPTANGSLALPYSDTTASHLEEEYPDGFIGHFDGRELPYVVLGGIGTAEDFAALEARLRQEMGREIPTERLLEGKLLLIDRGQISFAEKINGAAAFGAAGVVICDEAPAEESEEEDPAEDPEETPEAESEIDFLAMLQQTMVNMDMTDATLPAIFVPYQAGEAMKAAEDPILLVKKDDFATVENPDRWLMSAFSSHGVTFDLRLKPDITAVGENAVVSSYNAVGETVTSDSGTSYSAAAVSGAMAALKQYAAEQGMEVTPARLKAWLMNGAVPILDENGVEVSPRHQGAGLLNLDAAIAATGLLSAADKADTAKVELPSDTEKTFSVRFRLTNITDSPRGYQISMSLLADGYTVYDEVSDLPYGNELPEDMPIFLSGHQVAVSDAVVRTSGGNANLNRAVRDKEGNYGTVTVLLEAGESRTVELRVRIGDKWLSRQKEIFANGFFFEGYIYAESDGGTVSIPFVKFQGDWNALPIFDASIYSDETSFYHNTGLYTEAKAISFSSTVMLGRNITDSAAAFREDCVAFSPGVDGNGDGLYLSLDLLRDVSSLSYTLTNAKGDIIREGELGSHGKNRSQGSTASYLKTKIWDGTDRINRNYYYPDGTYYLTLTARPRSADENTKNQVLVMPFRVDNSRSQLIGYQWAKEGEEILLTLTLADAGGIQFADVYQPDMGWGDGWLYSATAEYGEKLDGEVTLSYRIDSAINRCPYVYIDVVDYAFNQTTLRLNLPAEYRTAD